MTSRSYDRLAGEYYDADRHPTCDDMRRASALLIDPHLAGLAASGAIILELGSGWSLLAERLRAHRIDLARTVLSDASAAMLAHSRPFRDEGARLLVAEAAHQPLADGTVGAVVAVLGDPYNDAQTWAEVARLLRPGGSCLFTTPAFDWARIFRGHFQEGRNNVAAFLVDGREDVLVPSQVHEVGTQRALFEAAGLRVQAVDHVSRAKLPGGARSAKFRLDALDAETPLVTLYHSIRQG